MNLYIRVIDGKPFEHPISQENLEQVVPNFDPENPPATLEKFVRVPQRHVGFLEIYEGSSYEFVDGVWQDVHNIRPLSEEEKAAKIQFAKDTFLYSDTWTLNEITGNWVPPVAYPNDGFNYKWDNQNLQWVLN